MFVLDSKDFKISVKIEPVILIEIKSEILKMYMKHIRSQILICVGSFYLPILY